MGEDCTGTALASRAPRPASEPICSVPPSPPPSPSPPPRFSVLRAQNNGTARNILDVYSNTVRRSLLAVGGYECQVGERTAEEAPGLSKSNPHGARAWSVGRVCPRLAPAPRTHPVCPPPAMRQEMDGAFMIAFGHPCDALEWCLLVQEIMMEIPWSREMLSLDGTQEVLDSEGVLLWRGPKVRGTNMFGTCPHLPTSCSSCSFAYPRLSSFAPTFSPYVLLSHPVLSPYRNLLVSHPSRSRRECTRECQQR